MTEKRFRKLLKHSLLILLILSILQILVQTIIYNKINLTTPKATPFFEDFQGNYISEGWGIDSPKGYWEIEQEIPHRVKQSFLAIEDKRFQDHPGVDIRALSRAVYYRLTRGPRHGASTIAMQVARMQTPGSRTPWKKLTETLTAYYLVKKFGREKILKQYLRLVPQGNRIHGTAYAARRYFKKPLQDLGWAETALLAALPKAPGRMNLFTSIGFQRATQRARIVLKELFLQNRITAHQYRVSLRHLKNMNPPTREKRPYHSFHAIANMEQAMKETGTKTFQRPVRSSLDLGLQEYLSFVSLDAMARFRARGAGNIAIIVVERPTGKIRGYLGSEYFYDKDHAGAIDYGNTPRSSGSTLKPFIFALGLARRKFTPSSVLADLPFFVAHSSGQYMVTNYDMTYLGPLVYRKALANSRNVPAVQVLQAVGLPQVHHFLKQIKLERTDASAQHYGLGLAIGGLYVTLQDLVRAYGILANQGKDFKLCWFEHLPRDPEPQEDTQVLPVEVSRQVALYLSDPQARLPAFQRMGSLEYPFPVAVKTGTSQGFRDAWAVAWSSKYIVGAWVGHPNNDRMKRISGSDTASVVKRVIMRLHPDQTRGLHQEPFPPPAGYPAVRICALSGQRATSLCGEVLLEYYKPGAQPVSTCRVHRQYAIDRRTGEIANVGTPASYVQLKTYTQLPPEYAAWSASRGYEKPPVKTRGVPLASVEIRNPVNRSKLMLDPETPRKFQTLALRAKVTPSVPHIIWIVDGKEERTVSYPYVYHWPLEPGEHTFRVRFPRAAVQSKPITITVSEY